MSRTARIDQPRSPSCELICVIISFVRRHLQSRSGARRRNRTMRLRVRHILGSVSTIEGSKSDALDQPVIGYRAESEGCHSGLSVHQRWQMESHSTLGVAVTSERNRTVIDPVCVCQESSGFQSTHPSESYATCMPRSTGPGSSPRSHASAKGTWASRMYALPG